MSAPEWSGRRSGRVVSLTPEPADTLRLLPISAPESLSLNGVTQPAPERRAPRASARTNRARAERVLRSLSERDQAVLTSVHNHRFLTTHQIQRFHFQEHATEGAASRICRRVLKRLHELRVIEHLERRVGGVRAGSASYVWRVGLVGDRLLRLQATGQTRGRRKEPSLRHLDHCLAVADCHLTLVALAQADRLELLRVETEPQCWRSYLGFSGGREILKPDLYGVTASGDYEDHWFIEIDRATESLPTLLRKCAQYEDYRRTGSEQRDGGVFPLVVWIVPTPVHADRLHEAIARSRGLDDGLYRICTPATFAAVVTGDLS